MPETTEDFDSFAQYVDHFDLHETQHDRVWWHVETPDERAFDAATRVADAYPDAKVVGTESRIQMSDVKWRHVPVADEDVIVMGFYPLRADKWTHDVIEEIGEKTGL